MFLYRHTDWPDLDDYAVHQRLMSLTDGRRVLFQRRGIATDILADFELPGSKDVSKVIAGLTNGSSALFTTRLNPVVTRFVEGKNRRVALKGKDIEAWVKKTLLKHGIDGVFDIRGEGPRISKKDGSTITLSSAFVSGILTVTEEQSFAAAVKAGVGHGKGLGFGMINIFAHI
jgi:CRISPR-associated protein Cas6/Cse3/CasE subtype I-E